MRTILAVARKEFRQIARDRRTLLILLVVPIAFLLLYGYALNFDIRDVPLAVQDNDRTSASREIVSAFVNSGYFQWVEDVDSHRVITDVLDRGDALELHQAGAGHTVDGLAGRVRNEMEMKAPGCSFGLRRHVESSAIRG